MLAECERGEDMAVKAYNDALAQDIPSDVRKLIERQYQGAIAKCAACGIALVPRGLSSSVTASPPYWRTAFDRRDAPYAATAMLSGWPVFNCS